MFKHFSANTVGRDFVVGDIHGMFKTLAKELEELGFDPEKDRLFSVGDLIDRGPDNEDIEEWLAKPWFHAVRGNHEQMLIDGFTDKEGEFCTIPFSQWRGVVLWAANRATAVHRSAMSRPSTGYRIRDTQRACCDRTCRMPTK